MPTCSCQDASRLNHQDSAATYLRRALQYARPQTSPNISDLYIELSNLYAQPLLPKDYEKTIEFARHAVEASHNERGKIGVENRSRALHDMGVAYSFLGKNDSATVYLEQALALTAPHDPEYTQLALNYAADCRADSRKGIDYLNRIKGENLGKRITLGFIYLNRNQIDSAEFYLTQSQQLFDSTPDRYSINTYNNLRLLKGCVDYARQGRGFPYEGMERNDSINQRLVLNQKIEAEKTEYNTQLQIHLLENEANRQRVWLICLLLLFLGMAVAAVVYVRSKERYIKIRKELDALCLAQIEREVSTLMTLILLPLRMPSLLLLIS